MSNVAVEVVEDVKRPEGGHAIIRLRGLNVLPVPSDFRIEPVDGLSNVGETSEWPLGPRSPVEARLTEQGVELVAGPDVVESPHLLPGTPVVISVPSVDVEAEILWPNVTPLTPTERRPVIAMPDVLAMAAGEHDHGTNGSTVTDTASGSGDGKDVLSTLTIKPAANGVAAAVEAVTLVAASAAAAAERAKTSQPFAASGDEGERNDTMRQRATVRRMPLRRVVKGPASPLGEPAVVSEEPAMAAKVYPLQRYAPPPETVVPDRSSRRLAAIAISVAVIAALSSIIGNLMRPSAGQIAAQLQAAAASAQAPVRDAAMPHAVASLYDVLATANVSPRGMSAEGVSQRKALEEADLRLHGPASARDPAEGAYWLKRSISASLGEPRTKWALTQLGSLYAEPLQGQPDYGKARLLWEIAGGLGDPVALCFLGSLSEFGIGGSVDKTAAAGWYKRAKRAGGCRNVDEAINRVTQ